MALIYDYTPAAIGPSTPDTSSFQNKNMNPYAPSGGYADTYGQGYEVPFLERAVIKTIFDARDKQYSDLKFLDMGGVPEPTNDEFEYYQMGESRAPILITANVGGGTTQTLTVSDSSSVSVDYQVVYPNGTIGIVYEVTNSTTIKVKQMTAPAAALPAVVINDTLSLLSTVTADGLNYTSTYFRQDTIRTVGFCQILSRAVRMTRAETWKFQNNSYLPQYYNEQMTRNLIEFRTDVANLFWLGKKGQVQLASTGNSIVSTTGVAKTTGGVYQAMLDAGSFIQNTTIANFANMFEQMVSDTEFGNYGDTRALFMNPKLLTILSKEYKGLLTRYTPDDKMADLDLSQIQLSGSNVVFAPLKRFTSTASFPTSFRGAAFLLDMKNIRRKYFAAYPFQQGKTLTKLQGDSNMQNWETNWIEGSIGFEINNPLAFGGLFVSGV